MSQNYDNNETTNQESILERLKKIAPTCYTTCNAAPTASIFTFTENQIKELLEQFAEEFGLDVSFVSLEHNPKQGRCFAYIWLPGNSANIRDNSAQSGTIINKPMIRYSNTLKEFMDKFSFDDSNKRLIPSESTNDMAIATDLLKIFKVYFDVKGTAFAKEFSAKRTETIIRVRCDYSDRGRFNFLEVRKNLPTKNDRIPRVKRKSHNVM